MEPGEILEVDRRSTEIACEALIFALSEFDSAFGGWESIREKVHELAARAPESASTPTCRRRLCSAKKDPAACSDGEYLTLATAEGPALEAVTALADSLRRDVVGDDVTYVVNRNINFTNICYAPRE